MQGLCDYSRPGSIYLSRRVEDRWGIGPAQIIDEKDALLYPLLAQAFLFHCAGTLALIHQHAGQSSGKSLALGSSAPTPNVTICTPFMLNKVYPLKYTTISAKNLPPFFPHLTLNLMLTSTL